MSKFFCSFHSLNYKKTENFRKPLPRPSGYLSKNIGISQYLTNFTASVRIFEKYAGNKKTNIL